MKMTRVKSALLGSGAAVALLAASVPASADQIDELRTQIQSLQDKMSQLEKSQVSKRRVAPAAAVEAGSKPRSWKLPGTNTSMQIGGYAKLDLIYDINAADGFAISGAPAVDGSAAGRRQGNFLLHPRQSRLWIRTWTPTDWGELETHIQGDFFAGNLFRMRHAYGRLGPVLAGQTWSNFMALHALPETLDFAGPTGDIFVRQAQIRYTHSFGGGTALVLAVENPGTGTVLATGGAPILVGPNNIPDFHVKLQHRYSSGMASIAAVFRQLQTDDGVSTSDAAFGYGFHFGIGHRFNNKKTAVGLFAYYGKGIGRYALGRTEAVLNGGPTVASLRTVTQVGGIAWIQHRWTDTIRTNLAYGRSYSNEVSVATGGKGALATLPQDVWTVHANLIWSPVPRVDIGVEYIYTFAGIINSANGKAHRIQVAFKYNF